MMLIWPEIMPHSIWANYHAINWKVNCTCISVLWPVGRNNVLQTYSALQNDALVPCSCSQIACQMHLLFHKIHFWCFGKPSQTKTGFKTNLLPMKGENSCHFLLRCVDHDIHTSKKKHYGWDWKKSLVFLTWIDFFFFYNWWLRACSWRLGWWTRAWFWFSSGGGGGGELHCVSEWWQQSAMLSEWEHFDSFFFHFMTQPCSSLT